MPAIKKDEIKAVRIGVKVYHFDCSDIELQDLEFDNIVTKNEPGDDDLIYFCDECNRLI